MKKFYDIDILLIIILTLFGIIFVLSPKLNSSLIRPIIGILFIIFLPGYSLIAALFPKKGTLGNFVRLSLSFAFSIALTLLIMLILNYTPFGIRLDPIIASISLFTIFMLFTAFFRRRKVPVDERINPNFPKFIINIKSLFITEYQRDKIFTVIIVVFIIFGAFSASYAILSSKEGEKFTEFYILSPNGDIDNYPTDLITGERGNVIIGVKNHEYKKTDYKLIVKMNNITIKEENISLASDKKYVENFTFNAYSSGKNQKLEFLLYKLPDNVNIYRYLNLRINVYS